MPASRFIPRPRPWSVVGVLALGAVGLSCSAEGAGESSPTNERSSRSADDTGSDTGAPPPQEILRSAVSSTSVALMNSTVHVTFEGRINDSSYALDADVLAYDECTGTVAVDGLPSDVVVSDGQDFVRASVRAWEAAIRRRNPDDPDPERDRGVAEILAPFWVDFGNPAWCSDALDRLGGLALVTSTGPAVEREVAGTDVLELPFSAGGDRTGVATVEAAEPYRLVRAVLPRVGPGPREVLTLSDYGEPVEIIEPPKKDRYK